MAHEIRPATLDDLPELGGFLREGFHAPADAPFAAEDVLRWKYFDPLGPDGGDAPRSLLARHGETGRVVGHLGVCPGRFRGPGLPETGVSTLHMIDWLSSKAGAGVGAALMRRAHQKTETQHGFGGSADGRLVGDRGGYGLVSTVPVHARVLRPSSRFQVPGQSWLVRALRAGQDAARNLSQPPRTPSVHVELRPAPSFGAEIKPCLMALAARAVFTTRDPEYLNHFLRYPRGGINGFHILDAHGVRGYAILSVLPRPGGIRLGRVVDCVVDSADQALWHAALHALTRELAVQRADVAEAFASAGTTASALLDAGLRHVHSLDFRLRDRRKLLPRAGFHLTPLEADYAYT